MTLAELETIRDTIKGQLEGHLRGAPGPGGETLWHVNAIELRTAVRTVEQILVQERAALSAPPGSHGPVLVGV